MRTQPSDKISFAPLLVLILAAALLAGCGGSEKDVAADRGDDAPLVAAMMPEVPPYTYLDPDTGEPAGIDVEIVRAAAAKLGRPLEIRLMPFAGILPAVKNGEADFAIAAITITEADRLAMNLARNAYVEYDGAAAAGAQKAVTALARLRIAFAAAGDDAAKKSAAIRAFAIDFADAQGKILHAMRQNLLNTANVRETEPPSTFASGITDILFDNFRVVSSALGGDSGAIVSDARRIAVDELHADISENAFTLFAIPTIVNAIQEDAEGAGDDNSYKIDIGI